MLIQHRPRSEEGDPEEASEGSYLASASDLMIGLLFVFIILVVVLALEQRRQQQAFEGQKDAFETQQKKVENERNALLGAGDPRGMVTDALGDGIRKVIPGIRVDRESGVISLPEDVLFDLGSAELNSRGRKALEGVAATLEEVLPCFVASARAGKACAASASEHQIETIFIEGHTDNRPMRGMGYDNTNLSLDRARSVERALVQRSALNRYRNKSGQPLFSLSAYADSRPLKGADPSDARNRRVDLRVVLAYRPIEELIPSLVRTKAEANRQFP